MEKKKSNFKKIIITLTVLAMVFTTAVGFGNSSTAATGGKDVKSKAKIVKKLGKVSAKAISSTANEVGFYFDDENGVYYSVLNEPGAPMSNAVAVATATYGIEPGVSKVMIQIRDKVKIQIFNNDFLIEDSGYEAPVVSIFSLRNMDIMPGNDATNHSTKNVNASQATNLTEIQSNAFAEFVELTNVSLPDSVTTIGAFAFYNCKSLQTISFPAKIETIGPYAFAASGISVLDLPSMENIPQEAFALMTNLTYVNMSEGTKIIEDGAFMGCGKLTAVGFPSTLTSIGTKAFYNCTSLKKISLELCKNLEDISYYAFGKVNPELVILPTVTDMYFDAASFVDFYGEIEDLDQYNLLEETEKISTVFTGKYTNLPEFLKAVLMLHSNAKFETAPIVDIPKDELDKLNSWNSKSFNINAFTDIYKVDLATVSLKAADAKKAVSTKDVSFTSTKGVVDIYVDGNKVGKTDTNGDFQITGLSNGTHTISAKNVYGVKSITNDIKVTVNVPEDKVKEEEVDTSKEQGTQVSKTEETDVDETKEKTSDKETVETSDTVDVGVLVGLFALSALVGGLALRRKGNK